MTRLAKLRDTDRFVRLCQIVTEDEQVLRMVPTPTQQLLMSALGQHRHNLVVKYRQAKVTTLAVMWMLGEVSYNRGIKGLLIANAEKTVDEGMGRVIDAYDNLPLAVRVPVSRRNLRLLRFMHGGVCQGITAGRGRETKPAMGTSPDRLIMTEFGEWENATAAIGHIMPSFRKRPHARSVIESTPGIAGCRQEKMWHAGLEGKGMYHPSFLRWWEDDTCVLSRDQAKRFDGWKPDNDAATYAEKVVQTNPANDILGVTQAEAPSLEHLKFRQDLLDSEFRDEEWLFTNKYPPKAHDGFVSSMVQVIPKDCIERQLASAQADPPHNFEFGCSVYKRAVDGRKYLITADPNSYGLEGDPSAFIVWDAHAIEEVATFEAREDPANFADRLMKVSSLYNEAEIAVESNAAACVATIVAQGGGDRLWWTNKKHPGWYSSARLKKASTGYFIKGMREGLLTIRSAAALHQAMRWDGRWRRRRDHEGGHFERLVCLFIAAEQFTTRVWQPAVELKPSLMSMTMRDLDRLLPTRRRKRR